MDSKSEESQVKLNSIGKIATIFGSSTLPHDDKIYLEMRRLGFELAKKGYSIKSGGYQGVMEAVSEGANQFNKESTSEDQKVQIIGLTLSPLFQNFKKPNTYLTKSIDEPNFGVRMEELSQNVDLIIAAPGSKGTLAEFLYVHLVKDIVTCSVQGEHSIKKTKIYAFKDPWLRICNRLVEVQELGLKQDEFTRYITFVDDVDSLLKLI